MSEPPAPFKDARHHRADHTDDGQQANHWEKPSEDDVGDDDPVERQPWSLEMSMESFLCHIQCLLILRELVLFPQLRLLFFVQTGEICLPTWAEIDVPTPEAAHQ